MSLLMSRKRRKASNAPHITPQSAPKISLKSASIPAGWRDMPAADLRALAKARAGRAVASKVAALEILEQELKHG